MRSDDFAAASADPLAEVAGDIIEHMNADHGEALVLLARAHAGVDAAQATMTAIDRLGFHVRCQTPEGARGVRIGLPQEARTAEEVRRQLAEMVRSARGVGD